MARLEALEGEKKIPPTLLSLSSTKVKKLRKKNADLFLSPAPPPPLSPSQVTHTADYFGQLHDIAVDLVKRDRAYVCHQTQEQVKAAREAREGSPYRDRPVQESLDLFAEMTAGNVAEGAATLRLKIDPKNNNLNMFDPVSLVVSFFGDSFRKF